MAHPSGSPPHNASNHDGAHLLPAEVGDTFVHAVGDTRGSDPPVPNAGWCRHCLSVAYQPGSFLAASEIVRHRLSKWIILSIKTIMWYTASTQPSDNVVGCLLYTSPSP